MYIEMIMETTRQPILRYTDSFNFVTSLLSHLNESIHGATAPSEPWPPSQDASIHFYSQLFSSILLSPAVVMHPSEPHPPI